MLTTRARRVPSRFGTDPTINKIMNNRHVAVVDPVVAPFDLTHTYHSFTIVLESCCNTLIDANYSCSSCSKLIWYGSDINKIMNNRYVAVVDPVVAPFDLTHAYHSFTIVIS
jgi:regulator of extracellular matrix RemA (YlzA/DUF370 family)